MDQNQMGQKCSCMHHQMVPAGIVIIGLSFLLLALGVISAGMNDVVWPIVLILIGLMKMMGHKCKCCSAKAGCCQKPEMHNEMPKN